MASTTYTVLVTVMHDDSQPPLSTRLESMIQRALEEGVREYGHFDAAVVSAIPRDWLGVPVTYKQTLIMNIKELHKRACT